MHYGGLVFLGWRNAFGEARGLKSSGTNARSRNPIFVVSILVMFGWGIMVGSTYLTLLLCIWAFLYLAAPFFDEPRLEKQYGADFTSYKERVPRFIGLAGRTAKRQ